MCAVWEGIKWLNLLSSAVNSFIAMSAGQKQAFTLLNADGKTKAEQDHIRDLHDTLREDTNPAIPTNMDSVKLSEELS